MARKKKSDSLEDLIQNPVTKDIQEETNGVEVVDIVEKEEDQNPSSEGIKKQEQLSNLSEENIQENVEGDTVVSLKEESLPGAPTVVLEGADEDPGEDNQPVEADIPQELLAEQEKIQQEADKEIQKQREKSEKPDFEKDVIPFEDFQESTIDSVEPVSRPFLIPLSKKSDCKYSVGLNTKHGYRVIAHKLSKEKAERYIENFLKVNR